MTSFTDVITGHTTNAADVNQLVDALNGNVTAGLVVSGGAGTATPYAASLTALPTSGGFFYYLDGNQSGDTNLRAGLGIRSDGYGSLRVGDGTNVVGNWYGQASGWKTDQSVSIAGNLSVVGTSTVSGIVASGTSSLDAGKIATDGAGNITTIKGITGTGTFSTSGGLTSSAGSLTIFGTTSLDNGTITTSGAGTVNMAGTLNMTGGTPAMGFTNAHALNLQDVNGVYLQFVHDVVGGANFTTFYNGFNTAGFGFKRQDGTKLAEFRANGNMTIAGIYQTGSFDAFDVAESFPCDTIYPPGMVVCPGPDGRLTRCTHPGCPCALIRPTKSGVELGVTDDDPLQQQIALAGRVPTHTSTPVAARQFVCSDGMGGVRAMESGETGFALGFALSAADQESVTVVLRAMYLQAL